MEIGKMIHDGGGERNRQPAKQNLLLFKPHSHDQISGIAGAQSLKKLNRGLPFLLGDKFVKFSDQWRSHKAPNSLLRISEGQTADYIFGMLQLIVLMLLFRLEYQHGLYPEWGKIDFAHTSVCGWSK